MNDICTSAAGVRQTRVMLTKVRYTRSADQESRGKVFVIDRHCWPEFLGAGLAMSPGDDFNGTYRSSTTGVRQN